MENHRVKFAIVLASISTVFSLGAAAAERQQLTPPLRMSPEQLTPTGPAPLLIACPEKLEGVHLSIDKQYTPPAGWSPLGYPTGYSSVTLKRYAHSVAGGKLNCSYGYSGLPTSLNLETISQPAPAGRNCTAVANFTFECL